MTTSTSPSAQAAHLQNDHVGGVVELARVLRIAAFVDHGGVPIKVSASLDGSFAVTNARMTETITYPPPER